MALKTLAELRTDVKNLVDDQSLADAILTGWINEARADLASVLRRQRKTTIAILPGTAEYDLPADFLDLRLVKLAGETVHRTVLELEDFESTGVKLWAGKITFQPTPEAADTATVWYHAMPPALSADTDKPDMPEAFQHLLVLYAASRAQYKDEELDEQSIYYREYLAGKQNLDRFTARAEGRSARRSWAVLRSG